MRTDQTSRIFRALDSFKIELPSWGFANTGTRFGKFLQAGAAATLEEKLSDAGQVHALTGACPTVALHVLWDLPRGVADAEQVNELAARYDQSEPVSGSDLQARVVWESGSGSAAESGGACVREHRDRQAIGEPGCFDVVRGWVELSGDGEYPGAEAVVRGGAAGGPPRHG